MSFTAIGEAVKLAPEHEGYAHNEAALLAMRADRDAYKRLVALALEHGWPARTQRVGQGSMSINGKGYIMPTGPGAENPWQRIVVMGTGPVFVTMDVQPIFETKLTPHLSSFVRVFDGQYNAVMPTLNTLTPDETAYGRTLTQYVLPSCVTLEPPTQQQLTS